MIIELEHVGTTIDLPEPDIAAADRLAYLLHYSDGPRRVLERIYAHLRDTRDPLPLYGQVQQPDPLTDSTLLVLEDLRRYTAVQESRRPCEPVTEGWGAGGAVRLICAAHGAIADVVGGEGQQDELDRLWYDHSSQFAGQP